MASGTGKRGRPRIGDSSVSADQLRRFRFIESAVLWTGKVGRRAVASAFDVSLNHVTLDFRHYARLAPDNLFYDLTERCYRPTKAFCPAFTSTGPSELLSLITSSITLRGQEGLQLRGFDIAADQVSVLPTNMSTQLLSGVVRAVIGNERLELIYQSLSSPEPVAREFEPSALIFTGYRWLVRGWDTRHEAFRDLAIARIVEVMGVAPPVEVRQRDAMWHEFVTARIAPAEDLSASQSAIIASEYGMKSDALGAAIEVSVRKALLPYLLDFHRLRPSERSGLIRLINYDELRPLDRVAR